MRMRTMLFGGAVGAAIAYLFDPVSGRGRRTRLRDQAMARGRDVARRAETKGRYLAHTAEGRLAEMRSPGPDRTDADDVVVAERIRADVLGRADVPKDRVSVDVADRVATLRGELDSQDEIDELERLVAAVPGVVGVELLLHLPGTPAPNKDAAIRASRAGAPRGTDPKP